MEKTKKKEAATFSMPPYKEITVVMTDGTEFVTRSTLANKGDDQRKLKLDIDPKTHPAWVGRGGAGNERSTSVKKFRDKYAMNFVDSVETK